MKDKYSKEFMQMISNKNKTIMLIKDSFSGGNFNTWKKVKDSLKLF